MSASLPRLTGPWPGYLLPKLHWACCACCAQEVGALVADVGSALAHVGLKPQGRVSVFGANSVEWMATMQVCGL